jgi:hypothetical protein
MAQIYLPHPPTPLAIAETIFRYLTRRSAADKPAGKPAKSD